MNLQAQPATHAPVLGAEVIAHLNVHPDGLYVDGTFGRGGYTAALLAKAPRHVYAFDRDPQAIAAGAALAARHANLTLIHARFSAMVYELKSRQVPAVDGIALDLGVSSPQIDTPERGFSFRTDGPLDMRMDNSQGADAATLVNHEDETKLADIIYSFGDERYSRRIARAIVAARATAPITRTQQLASIVRRIVPRSKDGLDPATRTFQALRIAVNDELGELRHGLQAAEQMLSLDGRLAVVSFHALEDRIVKDFIRSRSGRQGGSRHVPDHRTAAPRFTEVTRKPITPGAVELAANPRASSAKLRVASRTAAAAEEEYPS